MRATKKQTKLTIAKNIARGAFSSLTQDVHSVDRRGDQAPIERTSSWTARQISTSRLNDALGTARVGLSRKDLEHFNIWLESIRPTLDIYSNGLGVPLPSLGLFPSKVMNGDLEEELRKSLSRLQANFIEIVAFARRAKNIADRIGKRQYQSALDELEKAKNDDGFSFWYIESEMALTRQISGVDALKNRVKVFSINGRGQQPFIFYYFGVRNEPAQSSLRYRSTVKKVVDDSTLPNSLKSYLRFRLYGSLEPRGSVLANVLVYEQNTTLVDLFFTVVKVCNVIISHRRNFSDLIVIIAEKVLEELSDAVDFFSISSLDPLSANEEICELTSDVLNHLFARDIQLEAVSGDAQAVNAVAAQLSTRGSQFQIDEASKAFINMSWLPIANAIGEIQEIPSLPQLVLSNDLDGLSTPFLLELRKTVTLSSEKNFSHESKIALSRFWQIYELRQEQKLDELVELLNTELQLKLDGNVEDALTVVYADVLYETGDLKECVSICARAGRANARLLTLLPLSNLFVGKRWISLRSLGPSVDLAIALAHACKVIDDEKLRTFKRYATEELLTKYSCMTIDELIPKLAEELNHEIVAYFGYTVCDIPTIELLPGMGESRIVRRTRVKILRSLASLRTTRALAFETEALSMENALEIDDGLSVLDDSKVHVDEEAVVRYVAKEYEADFQRYKRLVASGIGTADSLLDIIKSLDVPSARIFQIPKNDADDLLVQLTNNIMQRFLYDPASGLDIIIGRRIRHNTISSELRGVLEKEELIGTIHHGRYQPADAIVRLVGTMNVKQKKIIFAANSRFSESIDQLVALLRDQYFNVRSRTKQRGVFELSITTVLFALTRTTAQTCVDLDQFTRECIDSFWLLLSIKLDVIRPDIETEIRRSLRITFQKFSTELVAQGADITLISSVQRAAEELQRRGGTIASWVAVPKLRLEARSHELRRTIDIAVAMVSGQVPGFKPQVKQIIEADIELDSRGFSIVSDALYVVIDNVAQHSGKRQNNNIVVAIEFDRDRSKLIFDITSEIAPSARKPDKLVRLQAIKTDIQKKSFVDGARRNKHSGLYKLAAIVHQSPNTNISFDFVGRENFNIKFDLEYIPLVCKD